uniref:Uncharacterized protein n=1 Tax=Plectus sambesii TaxID=2011161 RepID=A0A914WVS3_9BILA
MAQSFSMIPYLAVLTVFGLMQSASSLECFTCGVFLSAPERKCQGEATLVNCSLTDGPGCLFVSGKSDDGTFYVMKKCASKTEKYMKDGECADIQLESKDGTKFAGSKCYCTGDQCNNASIERLSLLALVLVLFTSLSNINTLSARL